MPLPTGVAADIDVTNIFAALQGGTLKSIAANLFKPAYHIRIAGKDTIALKIDGVVSLVSNSQAVITRAPIEGGTFQDINKVYQPTRLTMTVVIKGFGLANFDWRLLENAANWATGGNKTKPTEILSQLRDFIARTDLYDIETPKETFSGYSLINSSYRVSSNSGISMLTVQLIFEEVLECMEVSLSGGAAGKAGTTPVDLDNATAAGAGLGKARGGVLSTIKESVSKGLDKAKTALTNFGDQLNTARDDAIKFLKDNVL